MADTLAELAGLCPRRALVIAREMTKIYEEFLRGTVAELARTPREWLGEITMVLGPDADASRQAVGEEEIDTRIAEAASRGEPAKMAAMRIAAWAGRPRREIYARLLQAGGKKER
jgi:16S rRNA (cytidine1402-2'-O)-methyltransferase